MLLACYLSPKIVYWMYTNSGKTSNFRQLWNTYCLTSHNIFSTTTICLYILLHYLFKFILFLVHLSYFLRQCPILLVLQNINFSKVWLFGTFFLFFILVKLSLAGLMLFPKSERYQKVRSFADFDEYDGHCHKIKLNKTKCIYWDMFCFCWYHFSISHSKNMWCEVK